MKLLTLSALLLAALACAAGGEEPAKVGGEWTMLIEIVHADPVTLRLEQQGENLRGAIVRPSGDEDALRGTIKGRTIRFSVEAAGKTMEFTGDVAGRTMKGTLRAGDSEMPWSAKRK